MTLALALLTGVLARRAGLEQGTRAFEDLARVTAATLTPALDSRPGLPPDPPDDMRTHVAALVTAGPVVAVRVRSSSGQVLWADDRSVVGRVAPLPAGARRALQSGTVASLVAEPGDRHVVPGRSSGRVLVAYVAVRDLHGAPLLVEFHESYSVVTDLAERTWLRFAPAALGALALLQVLQVPLAWRLASRLRRSQQAEDALLQAAVDASDAERRRIAGDVHDHAVQDLTALAFELDAAQMRGSPRSPEDAELLGRTSQAVRQIVEDLRSLLVALIPARGSFRGGLLPALRVLAQELDRSGIRVTVRADDARDLPGPTAALLYRCAQEALRNVATHSRATSVEVAVTRHEGVATMVIEDDGHGFDESRLTERGAAGHVGLRALGELLVDAGGSLALASAPGKGTRLVTTVPLAAAASLTTRAAR
ncbi:ATP-binding protein [Geodermatophilus sp. DF01_2]|uniref:sensor histidine kinase n=1 Tax=Geodermatophilus sp. DF01-2 TaxID=2559610 RepID=UPI001ADDA559|nr:ATP-binding protein [Geodermatophilus sp. DF01_2]